MSLLKTTTIVPSKVDDAEDSDSAHVGHESKIEGYLYKKSREGFWQKRFVLYNYYKIKKFPLAEFANIHFNVVETGIL
jgi:hypothetical protein